MILAIQTNENMALTQSDLQRRINVTYSHLVESINEMVRMGLVSKMKKGRIAILTLTDDGKEMANLFLKIFPLVDKAKKKFG
jgi:DNA-binding MarR family transcriptional regulator